jgi:hypothetical protein
LRHRLAGGCEQNNRAGNQSPQHDGLPKYFLWSFMARDYRAGLQSCPSLQK